MKKNVANTPVNCEDTLYIIHDGIRMLQDILTLDVSPDLFLDKIINDMDFIDQTLAGLLKILVEDANDSKRDEQLDNLSETEWQFSQILVRFLSAADGYVERFPRLRDKILDLRGKSAARRKTADDSQSARDGRETVPLVGPDEMSELLRAW